MPMPLIPDMAVFQRKFATLPLVTYQAGETVLSAASTTGQLLILKEGAVSVIKEGLEIATVTEAGAVFGELSVLLDRPHTTPLGRRTKVAKFVEASRRAASTKIRPATTLRYQCGTLSLICGRCRCPDPTDYI